MPKRSLTLAEKLHNRLAEDETVVEALDMFRLTASPASFEDQHDLKKYLTEGALLNIGKIGSGALSIPCGEYMVWTTNIGTTMLVPSTLTKTPTEVHESTKDRYEIHTDVLLGNWNKIERSIAEWETEDGEGNEGNTDNLSQGDEDGQMGAIRSAVDYSTVDRPSIARAMEEKGFTVTSLAQEVGVDPPAISRILRKPSQSEGGDPGGRNPSMGLAAKICQVLRLDPTAAFPDIFGAGTDYDPRATPGNRGSGMDNAAHGSTRKGNQIGGSPMEMFNRLSKAITESGMAGNISQSAPKPMAGQHATGQQNDDRERRDMLDRQVNDLQSTLTNATDSVEHTGDDITAGQENLAQAASGVDTLDSGLSDMDKILQQLERTL